jgi:anthranilate phosphoribosyltransferase
VIKEAIAKVVTGTNLSEAEAEGVMREIMQGEATDAQISAYITSLRMKGETVEEITGSARVMREKAVHIKLSAPFQVDTCGTGGDMSHTFNISTTVAFVAAGAGVAVAKHGNRSVSSKSGSADVLQALGINIEMPSHRLEECLNEVGIAFLFAPMMHQAMKFAIGPRREIGIRTIFNVLGPLTNPAGVKSQIMGVYSADLRPACPGPGESRHHARLRRPRHGRARRDHDHRTDQGLGAQGRERERLLRPSVGF